MLKTTIWLDGRFIESSHVAIPLTSLTLSQGVGAFESMRVVRGSVPWIDRHVRRLRSACREMQLAYEDCAWGSIVEELARRCRLYDARARITIGDGFALVTCDPLPEGMDREQRDGVRLASAAITRPSPQLKGVSRAFLHAAEQAHGGEVLLEDADGRALETTRANVFAWRDGALFTAPATRVLPGIAREILLEIAKVHEIPLIYEAPMSPWAGAEIFLSNAVRGVRPVVQIDDAELSIGAFTRKMQEALNERLGI